MQPKVESFTDKQFQHLPNWCQNALLLLNWILFTGGIVSTTLGLIFVFRGKLLSRTIKIWFAALFLVAIPSMISIFFAIHIHPSSLQTTVLNFAGPRIQIFDKFLLLGLTFFTGKALYRPASYGVNTWCEVIETGIAMGVCFVVSLLSIWIVPEAPIDVSLMIVLMISGVALGFMWWRLSSAGTSAHRQLRDVTATVVSMNALAVIFLFFFVLERCILPSSAIREFYSIVLRYALFSEMALRGLCLLWIAEFREMFSSKFHSGFPPAPAEKEIIVEKKDN